MEAAKSLTRPQYRVLYAIRAEDWLPAKSWAAVNVGLRTRVRQAGLVRINAISGSVALTDAGRKALEDLDRKRGA